MLLRASRFFLYASLFSVAIVMASTFFPYIGGKYVFFRLSIELAVFLWLLAWATDASGALGGELARLFRRPLVRAVTAFVGIFLLASLFAYDRQAAIWSNYERGDGAFQMLHYYAFFLLLALLVRGEEWRRFLSYMLLTGFFVVGYGILAAAGVRIGDAFFLGPMGFGNWFHERFAGSLGNPAYTGSYLLFLVLWAVWVFFGARSRRERLFALAAGGVFLFFFFLTQTRGAFLGLASGMLAFFFYMGWTSGSRRRALFVGGLVLALLFAGFLLARNTGLHSAPVLGRLLRVSLSDRSVETRAWVWQAALKGARERPLLGWGPENFTAVFDTHFDTRHFVPNDRHSETWYDRAHNVFLDYLVASGFLGLFAYLAVFATFYLQFFRVSAPRSGTWHRGQLAALLAFPAAYLVQGIALFDVLPTYLNLFLFWGLAASMFERP